VFVSPGEAEVIAKAIRTMDANDEAAWVDLLQRHALQAAQDDARAMAYLGTQARDLQEAIRLGAGVPRIIWAYGTACPFLQKGVCAIYNNRPWACRSYMSSNAEQCWKACGTTDTYGNPFHTTSCYIGGKAPKEVRVAAERGHMGQLSAAVLAAITVMGPRPRPKE
jgi:Fe-S-cluster containining protein